MNEELGKIVEAIEPLRGRIRKEYRAAVLGVFGSYARGEQKPGSDVDMLVEFLPGATLLDLVGLADFLEERLSRRVDIVPVDTLREEIKEQVLREAVPV